jgi:PDZ domain-containing secreted protein/Zn-dependent protease/predicted transcriptional regulator
MRRQASGARRRAPWGTGSSFEFLRIRGIPIGAHWSWLLVFAFVVSSLAGTVLPQRFPGLGAGLYVAVAAAGALLFFGSIVLHELGHALVATREGMRIEGISLWVFGGVARMKGMFKSPGTEFRVAIAGPLVSAALAAVLYGLSRGAESLGLPEPVVGTAAYLAQVNAILVGFNLVPALPLDGGRVLRAWLWYRHRSLAVATSWAARAGAAFGVVLSGIGVLGLLSGGPNGGVWLIFLGWFLTSAAQGEAASATLAGSLEGLRVKNAMTPDPRSVRAGTTLEAFFSDTVGERGFRGYPVTDDGRLVGVVALERAGRVHAAERWHRTVDEVMTPASDMAFVEPESALLDAAELLQEPNAYVTVIKDQRLVGVLTASDLRRAMATRHASGVEERRDAGPATDRRVLSRPGVGTLAVVATIMAIAAGALYYPPYFVVAPGAAIDVARDITIAGVPADRPTGRYLLTSVRLDRENALGVLLALAIPERHVLSASSVMPRGVDPRSFNAQQRELFRQSRRLAAAAAARAAGMEVTVTGRGAVVREVLPDSPADGALQAGDVITAIDGDPVTTTDDVRNAILSEPTGTVFRVEIRRSGDSRTIEVSSARLQGSPAVGIVIVNRDLDVELPFDVTFTERPIGGPSAGLAFALAIADMIDQVDYARGRTIAVTGTIDAFGDVGPVGGVEAKMSAAEEAGAALLVVPEVQAGAVDGSLEVHGVATLEEALRALRPRSA